MSARTRSGTALHSAQAGAQARAMVLVGALVLLVAVGCGNDDAQVNDFIDEVTGTSYDVPGEEWVQLDKQEALAVVSDFIDDHPDECGRNPDARLVQQAVALAYQFGTLDISKPGAEVDPSAPVGDVIAETC